MIVKLQWSKKLAVGIDKIDQQHKELFSIINDLVEVYQQGAKKEDMLKSLLALLKYAGEHFVTEDEYMTMYNYPQYSNHRKEHTSYVSKIEHFAEGYEADRHDLTTEMLKFLSQWWLDHVSGTDAEFGMWLKMKKK